MELSTREKVYGTVVETYLQLSDVSDEIWSNEKYQKTINEFYSDMCPTLYNNRVIPEFENLLYSDELKISVDKIVDYLNTSYGTDNYTEFDIVNFIELPEAWTREDKEYNNLDPEIYCLIFEPREEDMYDSFLSIGDEYNILFYPRQRSEFEKDLIENNYNF